MWVPGGSEGSPALQSNAVPVRALQQMTPDRVSAGAIDIQDELKARQLGRVGRLLRPAK